MKIQQFGKLFKKNESGRSMVEMLGVLAVIGVLSVGGIYGYKQAMMKIRMNKFQGFLTSLHLSYLKLKNEGYELDTSGTSEARLNNRFDLCDMGFLGEDYCRDLGSDSANTYWPRGTFSSEKDFYVATTPYLQSEKVVTRLAINGWENAQAKDYCYALFSNIRPVSDNPNAVVRIGASTDNLYFYVEDNFAGWREGCDKLAAGNTSQAMIYLDGFF